MPLAELFAWADAASLAQIISQRLHSHVLRKEYSADVPLQLSTTSLLLRRKLNLTKAGMLAA